MSSNQADMRRELLREDIAEVLDDDNGYSYAVQTWAAIAGDLLEEVEASREPAAEAAVKRVRALHYPIEGIHCTIVCAHRHCVDDMQDQCEWPCPTARAIEEDA